MPAGPESENEDRDLVRACLAGRREAHEALLARYRGRIYGFLLRMVRNPSDAEDLAQEAFLKAFRSLASYDPGRPFHPWLFRIARNAAIDFLRRRPAEEPVLFDPSDRGLSLEESLETELEARLVEKLLAALPLDTREAMLLRFREGLEYAEMSEILGEPVGTLKARVSRGREMMRKKLDFINESGDER